MASGFLLSIGVLLVAAAAALALVPGIAYRIIDRTSGRTAEDLAPSGFNLLWKQYHGQRPLMRIMFPIALGVIGLGFIATAVT